MSFLEKNFPVKNFFCIMIFFVIIFLSILSMVIFAEEEEIEQPDFNLTAKSAILMEVESGQIIYSKNPHKSLPPASMTKIMTMLLVMEAIEDGRADLEDTIIVSEYAAGMGGSQIWLEVGEEMTLKELMKAIAIASANDASVAVAEYLYGTANNFVVKMNERAKELGLKDTHFYNPTGLPSADSNIEGNYSSAYDLAVLGRELLNYPKILEWTSIWIDYLRDGASVLNNTNRLIRDYPGTDGIKTGYIREARFCVTATSTRNDLRFITVIMGAETSNDRWDEAKKLFNYGFRIFDSITIAEKDEIIDEIKLINSRQEKIQITVEDKLIVPIHREQKENIKKQIVIDKNLKAPLEKGAKVGTIRILKDDTIIKKADLIVDQKVEKATILQMIIRLLNQIVIDTTNFF